MRAENGKYCGKEMPRDVEDLDLVEQGSLVSFNECFLVCRVTGAICCILI